MQRQPPKQPASGSHIERPPGKIPEARTLKKIHAPFVIGLTLLITSACTSKIPANQWTAIAQENYPGMTNIHQEVNVIEGIYQGQKIVGYIDAKEEWVELHRRPLKPIDAAEAGQIADVMTTGVALSQGFSEANPLGIGILPLKFALNYYAEQQGLRQCGKIKTFLSATGWGAAAANLVTISAGTFTGGSAAAGLLVGAMAWNHFPGTEGCEGWLGQPVELTIL
ncbi:hypothetical protein [Thiolapillus sp.]